MGGCDMSDCACIYVECTNPPEFYNSRIVTAKKIHKCGECNKDINPGSKYEYVVGTWEGDFDTHKTCNVCLELRETFFCDGWTFGEIHEHLWNHIQEMDGDLGKDCFCSLSFKAKIIVWEMIARYKEEE